VYPWSVMWGLPFVFVYVSSITKNVINLKSYGGFLV